MSQNAQLQLVGVLNVTPDSFSDGGKFLDPKSAIKQAEKLFSDGATIVDIGAESTNPWSSPLTAEQEWQRLELILPELMKHFPGKMSLDTYHPETAKQALEMGPIIINDVTMFRNPALIQIVVRYQARCIVAHLSPASLTIADAHKNPRTTTLKQVKDELLAKRDELIAKGLPAEKIILDPGIGFGKTMELNRQLLKFPKEVPGIEVLIGHSRKRFLGEHRMEIGPNVEAAKIAIAAGAHYLRVHDVKAHKGLLT